MAPLFVFGVQDVLGWWTHAEPGNYRDFYHWIKASWLPMELATILAGLIALRFFRFPFLMAPIAVALWFMSMDLVPWIFGEDWSSWEQRKIVSDIPVMAKIDAVPENEWQPLAAGKMGAGAFGYAVTDFYLSNPIARTSQLMAELSANAKARRDQAIAAE